MKIGVSLTPGIEPRPTKVLAEGRGSTDVVEQEGSYKYQQRPCDLTEKRFVTDRNIFVLLGTCLCIQ